MLLPAAALPAAAQQPGYVSTRSPHGNLAIPCQNCHTAAAWKPIRAIPEFDHNKTRYPLRGMHEKVACVQCHTKPVFTNVGSKCADCHADIHRRQMGAACENCHTVKGWDVSIQSVQNHQNRFPLMGAHAALDCQACHKGAAVGQFMGLSTQCYSCHARTFQQTTNPNHVAGKFPTACEQCHGVDNWLNARFDHSSVGFPLTGGHANLQCSQCHINNNYSLTSTACVSCHLKDFQSANNPSHVALNFSQNCQQCHTTVAWEPATFDHTSVGFPLTGGHANLQCTQCHVNNNYNLTNTACVTCHQTDYNNATTPVNHIQLGFPTTCQNCHDTVAWTNGKFDHSTTGWALTGTHATTSCAQCHVNNNYNLTSANTACVSCHQTDYNNATTPVNHIQLAFPTTCQNCHDTVSWTNGKFDHSTTGWALTGAHATVVCSQCHVNNNYNLTITTCVSCHLKDFQGTTNPNHVQQGFAQTCETCHNTTAWQPAQFDHSKSGFPLTGTHATTPCAQCHVNNNYNITNTACVSCHQTDYNNAVSPINHVQLAFPTTCQNCHDTVAWTNGKFDHSTTGFALTGTHATTPCAQCHVNNNYNLTSANTACVSCHQNDYNNAVSPINHVQLAFPTTCQNCHDTVAWTNGKFDHSTTGFALTGAHASTACAQCHVNNNYNLTSANTACVSCHQNDYNTAVSPVNHVQLGFPTTCQNCHDTVAWTNGRFDHSTTGWALTGTHATTPCAQCHVNNNYSLTSANTVCVSCHLNNYNTAVSPVNHVQAGLPTTCETCHDTVVWSNGKFNHATTGWALTGTHLTTPCTQCHVNNNYKLTNTACVTCHQTDYNNAVSPVNHIAAGFPTTCDSCHGTVVWTDGKFNHTTTGFALTGAHATLQCTQCHVNNNYKLSSTACVTCHQTDYNNARTPVDHVAQAFPTTCDMCHDTTAWTNATFNHNNTPFPLTGAHTTVACANCHVNNNYTTVPTDCYSCHKTDYQGTTNPNHAAAGFPTTCQTCHTTTSWAGATFNHTWFPTNHGNAQGVCATCHTNSSNYAVFTCTNCHTQATTTQQHQGVRNFVWNSANCYQCHPSGRAG
jgi:hypothetical protein